MSRAPGMPATAVWGLTTAALGLALGAIIDIAWDASIGRHSWASPPHLLINLCAALSLGVVVSRWRQAGMARTSHHGGTETRSCSEKHGDSAGIDEENLGHSAIAEPDPTQAGRDYLSNLFSSCLRASVVRNFGEVSGLAALLGGCGGAALLLAEVHAEWFGLNVVTADVEPGWMASVAVAGMFAVGVAAVLAAAQPRQLATLRLACIALLLLTATAASPYSLPNLQRTALFVQLSAALYPGLLMLARRVLARPFGATEVSAGYMAVMALLVWTLPLWPARPEVAPEYQSIEA